MKRFGNTLYITTQGTFVQKDGTNLVLTVDREERLRIPARLVGSVVSFGAVQWTPFALGLCAEEGVSVAFLSERGRFLARVSGPQSGNVLLRLAQFERTRDPESQSLAARAFVSAKIANARTVLLRAVRDHGDKIDASVLKAAIGRLAFHITELSRPIPVEQVRGVEGTAARVAFSVFDRLIVAQKESFFFRERSRRPPTDNLNALLSFLYTLLACDLTNACEAVGLDPQVGFLHAERSGRASLALDLMEEFRPWLAERLALSLINRRQIDARGFETNETGAVAMNEATRKIVLKAWQERKEDVFVHPFLNEKTTIGLAPFLQAQLLARWLRGDLDAYPPIFWK